MDQNNNIFEDNFYMDSVERYNVKYKPPSSSNNGIGNLTGGSGAPG
jgi:hypothetical protein